MGVFAHTHNYNNYGWSECAWVAPVRKIVDNVKDSKNNLALIRLHTTQVHLYSIFFEGLTSIFIYSYIC